MKPKKMKLTWSETNKYEVEVEVPYEKWEKFEDDSDAFDWYYFEFGNGPSRIVRPPKLISGEFEPDSIVVKMEEEEESQE